MGITGHVSRALSAVVVCVSLSACGATDGGAQDNESLAEVDQALVADGFWQPTVGPEVYWLHDNAICWVRDPGMVAALRWTTTSQVSRSGYTLTQLRSGRVDQGYCHYPDSKLLKTRDSDWVYRTSLGGFCHVKDLAQLAQYGGWSKVLVMQTTRQQANYSEGGEMGAEGVWYGGGERFYSGDCAGPPLPP